MKQPLTEASGFMANLITGLIAVALISVFLGNYAIRLGSIALWIIIVAILAMVTTEFVQSLRKDGNQEDE